MFLCVFVLVHTHEFKKKKERRQEEKHMTGKSSDDILKKKKYVKWSHYYGVYLLSCSFDV